jgi:hypothetical protein
MNKLSLVVALGLLLFGSPAIAAPCSVPNGFSPGTTISSSQVNNNFQTLATCTSVSTRQILTSGSGTYTTPANARQLRIRMVGGGGGGAGTSSSARFVGTNGSDTVFNGVHAAGGVAATSIGGAQGGYSTTPGTGSASYRAAGGGGGSGAIGGVSSAAGSGGQGGNSVFGAGPPGGISTGNGVSAAANTGAGGSGSGNSFGAVITSGGGQAGEYVELIINSPSATYTYTIGAGGTGGTGGTEIGGNGGSGIIIVEEFY